MNQETNHKSEPHDKFIVKWVQEENDGNLVELKDDFNSLHDVNEHITQLRLYAEHTGKTFKVISITEVI